MLSMVYSSSLFLSCEPVSSPSSKLSDAQDTALIGGCGFVGVSDRRNADLLGELVGGLVPENVKGNTE